MSTIKTPGLLAALAVALLSMLMGCGAAKSPPPSISPPPPPTSADAWFGTAGNVLISDRGFDNDGKIDFIWVGFNSQTAWQNFLALHQNIPAPGGFWIGGIVVATSANAVGFYFDPNSTSSAEITAEVIQTSLDQIKSNPAQFAKNVPGRWVILAVVEQTR